MNQIVKFNSAGAALAIPAHIASFFGEESNIEDRVTVPSLSYEGKVWTVSANGDKRKLTKVNDDGDEEAVGTMRVVILDYAKRRGRALYEGAYDPSRPGKPTCWSEDGIAAHTSVARDGAMSDVSGWTGKCDGCPMSIKGSKINDNGKAVTACSQHRMLAIVPANKLDFTPLRLKLSITSDWDGQSPDLEAQGWFAFSNFTSYLQKKGASHTAAFVTKMRFDPNVTWPKVMFAHDRWLTDAELSVVRPIVKSDDVKGLLAGTWTATGVDGEKIADEVVVSPILPTPIPAKPVVRSILPSPRKPVLAPEVAAEPFIKPMLMDEDDDFIPQTVVAPPAKPVVKKITAKDIVKKAAAAPVVSNDVPADVEALLAEWGDD